MRTMISAVIAAMVLTSVTAIDTVVESRRSLRAAAGCPAGECAGEGGCHVIGSACALPGAQNAHWTSFGSACACASSTQRKLTPEEQAALQKQLAEQRKETAAEIAKAKDMAHIVRIEDHLPPHALRGRTHTHRALRCPSSYRS